MVVRLALRVRVVAGGAWARSGVGVAANAYAYFGPRRGVAPRRVHDVARCSGRCVAVRSIYPTPAAALPDGRGGPYQPPQTPQRTEPIAAEGRPGPPDLDCVGDPGLQRRHPRRPAAVKREPDTELLPGLELLLPQPSIPTSRRLPPFPWRTSTAPRRASRSVSAKASDSPIRNPVRHRTTISARRRTPSGPGPAVRHHGDDLLDGGRVCWGAPALVAGGRPA